MTGSSCRPPESLPPWLPAILIVAGFLLVVSALPTLASAMTSGGGGTPPTAAPRSQDSQPAPEVRGLPRAGGHSVPALSGALLLLGGGLVLLKMVGFSGEGPWPGRYVRRSGEYGGCGS